MNLVHDPWIPTTLNTGEAELISIQDAFELGELIRDLSVTPPQRIAIMRLFVCIAHAALNGPKTEAEWSESLPKLATKVAGYLGRFLPAFELYGKRAFLQVPNLKITRNAVTDKLVFEMASGNNSTIFDHEATPEGRYVPDAQRALALLTYQCISPGGMTGRSEWGGKPTIGNGNSIQAPAMDGGPLHLIVRSENLLSTIHDNLLSRELLERLPNFKWGRPVWEKMPEGADDPRNEEIASSYLGRLVPVSRAIKLEPDRNEITLANGLDYPKFPEFREPSTTVVVRKKDKQGYLHIDLSKHTWRQLGSILATSQIEGRALVLSRMQGSPNGNSNETVDIWTGGLVADQSKLVDTAEWSLCMPRSMFGKSALHKYERGVELANKASTTLYSAVSTYFGELKVAKNRSLFSKATDIFWSRLDGQHPALLRAATSPELGLNDEWFSIVRYEMTGAYRQVCSHETPKQIQAYAAGKRKLRLKKVEEGEEHEAKGTD
jgi:CRISPR system Cascade subunit CasA